MTTPRKFEIAQYWLINADMSIRKNFKACDMGEPSCFACGYYAEYWDDADCDSRWEKAALEKCHLVPRSLGGTADASNLVLLCRRCHDLAPDYIDGQEMLKWIATRESWIEERGRNLLSACKALGIEESVINEFLDQGEDYCDEIFKQVLKRAGSHLGTTQRGLKASTFALVMRDALEIDLARF